MRVTERSSWRRERRRGVTEKESRKKSLRRRDKRRRRAGLESRRREVSDGEELDWRIGVGGAETEGNLGLSSQSRLLS
ncbi:hypothetical protein CRG98_014225 [Punica granatum]|uniref:Uncharacterized protein n=1 Tax=Punica granatum TaxID=22663 RepID=A0A2I0KA16_PUNGR|nr:hypothetical protein CRG98_014225 [Punica granatum]